MSNGAGDIASGLAELTIAGEKNGKNGETAPEPSAGVDTQTEGTGGQLLSHRKKLVKVLEGDVPNRSAPRKLEEAKKRHYRHWDTEPVPKFDEECADEGPIEPDRNPSEIRQEPYSLPAGFEWSDVNVNDEGELRELYTLLNENYVEDDDHMFRFDYSPAFLKWALLTPGWRPQWHCGVRAANSKKLVAFFTFIPYTMRIDDVVRPFGSTNYLCVHKKLRGKRVAPVIMKELARRGYLGGRFNAFSTAGVIIPKPVAYCSYYHRPLNSKKLIDVEFLNLPDNMTMQRTLKLYKLDDVGYPSGS